MAPPGRADNLWEQSGRSLQYRTLADCWRQCPSSCPGRDSLRRLADGHQAYRDCLPKNWSGETRHRQTVRRLAQLQLAELLANLPQPPHLSYDSRVPYGFRCRWGPGQELWLTTADPGYRLDYRGQASHGRSQWFSQQPLGPVCRPDLADRPQPILVAIPGTNLVLANPEDWQRPMTISWSRAEASRAPTPVEAGLSLPINRWPEAGSAFRHLLCCLVAGDNAAIANRRHILARVNTAAKLPRALADNFSLHCYQQTRVDCLAVKPERLEEAA